ncbi:unnamed protein product [Prorocentrum cordatum]|uniref:beta-glucosidase n=1 Tax=Prorocentrum cordatum TaxID=2364126 RepID=A0ABN9PEK6_9DINO|nr:unnamed protein product [Polarella glacialis]
MLLAALAGGAALHGMLALSGVVLAGVVVHWRLRRQRARAEEAMLLAAGAAAAAADAVVLALGTDGAWESEGMDQLHMRLLGRQNELVERVTAAARGPVVVLLNVGSPKELPWLGEVQAVLLVHFGGEELAPAVADALLGASCPAGRLPYSWPRRLGDAPAVAAGPQAPGEARYCEGLRLGYRGFGAFGGGGAAPLLPFGHGLSYSSFSYGPLEASQLLGCEDPGGPSAVVRLAVGNRGSRAGAEVVQLYARAGPEGMRALGAFARTRVLEPGEEAVVQLAVGPRALGTRFCEERGAWEQPAAGSSVALEVGASSADVRATAVLVLT